MLASKDYAESTNRCISINANAFRSTAALAEDYGKQEREGFFVRGTTYKSIAYHEMGHVVVEAYGLSYKTITKGFMLRDFLKLSEYASSNEQEAVAEAFSAIFSGIDNEVALTLLERFGNMLPVGR